MHDALYNLVRDHFKTMDGYVSAGMEAGKSADKIYLNANENPYELPGLEGLNRYPEPQPLALLEAFAQNYSVEHNEVAITRGADEAIVLLTKVFCEPHQDKIMVNTPTFGMYAVDAHAMPAGVITVPLVKTDDRFSLDQDAIIKHATNPDEHIKIIYLCSPNNPTGNSFPHDDIADLCSAVEGHAVVVLDETYAEFSTQGSMAEDLSSTPNLIILRTLSKSYAFAGMRVGCMLCADSDFIDLIKCKAMDAYPLPRLSIEAAFHVLSPEIKAIAQENIRKILAERERVAAALSASEHVVRVYPSDANFLLVEMQDAAGFHTFAGDNNVILRDFSNKPLTQNCLRISIGTPEENETLLALLHKYKPDN